MNLQCQLTEIKTFTSRLQIQTTQNSLLDLEVNRNSDMKYPKFMQIFLIFNYFSQALKILSRYRFKHKNRVILSKIEINDDR